VAVLDTVDPSERAYAPTLRVAYLGERDPSHGGAGVYATEVDRRAYVAACRVNDPNGEWHHEITTAADGSLVMGSDDFPTDFPIVHRGTELSPVYDVRAWVFVAGDVLPDGSIAWHDDAYAHCTRCGAPVTYDRGDEAWRNDDATVSHHDALICQHGADDDGADDIGHTTHH
jgi:hypothetical protein